MIEKRPIGNATTYWHLSVSYLTKAVKHLHAPVLGAVAVGMTLLLAGACTEVHVRWSHHNPSRLGDPPYLSAKEPISLAELVKRQQAMALSAQKDPPTSLCNAQGMLNEEVRPYNQEAANWCWATSTQTVLEFHKEIKGQCEWVNGALSRSDCCGKRDFIDTLNRWFTDTPSACDEGGWPHWIFNSSGFDYEWVRAPASPTMSEWTPYFNALKTQLCRSGPFISVIRWSEGGRHTQVVRAINDTLQVVEVNDHRDADFNTQPFDVFIGDDVNDPYGEFGHAQEMFYVEIRRE